MSQRRTSSAADCSAVSVLQLRGSLKRSEYKTNNTVNWVENTRAARSHADLRVTYELGDELEICCQVKTWFVDVSFGFRWLRVRRSPSDPTVHVRLDARLAFPFLPSASLLLVGTDVPFCLSVPWLPWIYQFIHGISRGDQRNLAVRGRVEFHSSRGV